MENYRYEDYSYKIDKEPCVINSNIVKTVNNHSDIANWHKNIEIQLCVEGSGYVVIDSKKIPFSKGSIIMINSEHIHYTATDDYIKYHCIIMKTEFTDNCGLYIEELLFEKAIENEKIKNAVLDLVTLYKSQNDYYVAQMQIELLEILIELVKEHNQNSTKIKTNLKNFDEIRNTISYIRENYNNKVTLDDLAKINYIDKFSLSRKFKQYTGKTIFNYINNYRCKMAKEYIKNGKSVNEAAELCGFENVSFFTKMFKKQMGELPSYYKKTD